MRSKLFKSVLSVVLAGLMIFSGIAWLSPALLEVHAQAAQDVNWEVRQVSADFSSDRGSDNMYANDTLIEWVYTYPGQADYLKLSFSAQSATEGGYDMVYIITESGAVFIETDDFGGDSITVKGGSFRLFFKTDYSVTDYGFDVAVVTGSAADLAYAPDAPADTILPDSVCMPVFLALAHQAFDHYIPQTAYEVSWLNLSSFKLGAVPDLSEFTSLFGIDLYNNWVTTLDGVAFPDTLGALYIGLNRINSIEGASFPDSLYYLDLEFNQLPFSDKDAIYQQLDGLIGNPNNSVYIGYQGPYAGTTRAAGVWFGYHGGEQPDIEIRHEDEADPTTLSEDTYYPLTENGAYYITTYGYCEGVFVKLGTLEERYTFSAGETDVTADFNASALSPGALDAERNSDDIIISEITLSLTKTADATALLRFSAALGKTDTRRVYDGPAYGDDGDIVETVPDYTDTALEPVALASSDLAGVAMLIPLSADDAAKDLKLTANGAEVDFDILTQEGQTFLSFTLSALGDYRLYALEPTQTPDKTDEPVKTDAPGNTDNPATGEGGGAAWLLLGGIAMLALGTAAVVRRGKKCGATR